MSVSSEGFLELSEIDGQRVPYRHFFLYCDRETRFLGFRLVQLTQAACLALFQDGIPHFRPFETFALEQQLHPS